MTLDEMATWNILEYTDICDTTLGDIDHNFIVDGLPSFGERVLVTDGKNVWIDAFGEARDYGVYLEEKCEYVGAGDIVAWMPLPKTPKVE